MIIKIFVGYKRAKNLSKKFLMDDKRAKNLIFTGPGRAIVDLILPLKKF